jgi:DNA-binding CsgD family transcriptional regulator
MIDLQPFVRSEFDQLVESVLGPATVEARDALFSRSMGNPLYARELIFAGVGGGALACRDSVWRLEAPLPEAGALFDSIRQRFQTLSPGTQRWAGLLARCQPIGLGLCTEDELVAVDELERAGVVAVVSDDLRREVRFIHPLYAECAAAASSIASQRTMILDHVRRVEQRGSRRSDDTVRSAILRLGIGEPCSADDLVVAARITHAGRDYAETRRLITIARHHDPTMVAHTATMMADVLYELGEHAELVGELRTLMELAPSPEHRVEVAIGISRTQLWWLAERAAAIGTLDRARSDLDDPGLVDIVDVARSDALGFGNAAADALQVCDDLELRGSPWAEMVAGTRAAMLAALGQTSAALAAHPPLPTDQASLRNDAIAYIKLSYVWCEAGMLDQAAALSEQIRSSLSNTRAPIDWMWSALTASRPHLLAGRLRVASSWAADALATARHVGLPAGQALAASAVAAAAAQTGDAAGAAAADRLANDLTTVECFLDAERFVGRAWAAFAAGGHSHARQLLLEGADQARADGLAGSESFLLYEILRQGGLTDLARLADLASACESPVIAARAEHAAALSSSDCDALLAVADRFAAMGFWLNAAEALCGAATVAPTRRTEAALKSRAGDIVGRYCDGVSTPLLSTDVAGRVGLTRREQEIAVLAAGGATAKEIAAVLNISSRTVDNHLQRIYLKLGVSSRWELKRELGEGATPGPPLAASR